MSVHKKEIKRITTHVLLEMKQRGEKIAMLTGYDFSMAKIIDNAGIDIILVGDSASNVMAGHETTLPITLTRSARPTALWYLSKSICMEKFTLLLRKKLF